MISADELMERIIDDIDELEEVLELGGAWDELEVPALCGHLEPGPIDLDAHARRINAQAGRRVVSEGSGPRRWPQGELNSGMF